MSNSADLQKPTDLDLHCLLRQGMSCSAREGIRKLILFKGRQPSEKGSTLNGKNLEQILFF